MLIPSTTGVTGVCAQEMIPLLEASRTEAPTLHIASYWRMGIVGGTQQYSRTISHVGLTPEERGALIDRYGAKVVQSVLTTLRSRRYDKGLDKRAYAACLGGSSGVAIPGRSNSGKGINMSEIGRLEGDAEQAAIAKCGGTPGAQTESSCRGCCGCPHVCIGLLFFVGRSWTRACSTAPPTPSC
jgi:hypothetical protein